MSGGRFHKVGCVEFRFEKSVKILSDGDTLCAKAFMDWSSCSRSIIFAPKYTIAVDVNSILEMDI